MACSTERLSALALLGLAPAVAALAPSPWSSPAAPGPAAPLVAALGLLAWACTGWLLLVVLVTAGGQLPGALGRGAGRLGRRLAPATLHGLLRVALGSALVTTAAGSVLAGTAHADPGAPVAAVSPALDWPTAVSSPAATSPSPSASATPLPGTPVPPTQAPGTAVPPSVATASPVAPHRPHRAAAPGVVVRRGDSLWSIAAHALGPRATDAQVAQAWPQWWSANRAVVGADPDLLHPGTPLSPPTR
jgi:nucleoid-associated protein YgaU